MPNPEPPPEPPGVPALAGMHAPERHPDPEPGPIDEKDRAPLWVVFLVVFLIAGCAGPLIFIALMFWM